MPTNLVGAYVPVFLSAANQEAAAIKAVSKLTSQGFEFIDIPDRKNHELDPLKWDTFVKDAWPDFREVFPSQNQILREIDSGFIFIGPFASYESHQN